MRKNAEKIDVNFHRTGTLKAKKFKSNRNHQGLNIATYGQAYSRQDYTAATRTRMLEAIIRWSIADLLVYYDY